MAIPEAVTWDNLGSLMNNTQLNYFIPSHKNSIQYVCSDDKSRFSFVQCYLRILTLSIARFNEKSFDCSNQTIQNIYNLTMPGFFVQAPIPFCYDQNVANTKNCTLMLTSNDVMYWTYRQAVLNQPTFNNCMKPWKYIKFLSEKITNVNLTASQNIANSTMNFINRYINSSISMEKFLLTTIYNMAQPLGPRCSVEGLFSLSHYANKRLTERKN
ncbi:envelope glycoprotein O [Elephantid betaherpesvirus 1]|uniref:Protein ORF D n=4 Tax=Elephantid herpesvirus 1 TaxID=146015 RepID=ORFD_ELHVK|nr:RecName: Full=Protein ORF D [Elephantid herpesvirus 1 (isolate Kiba)]ABG36569.1 ORF D [Elephantid betaherpesvirus 1]ADK70872.1 envelope glycoprotein O [Elephant endotheliotropic herpesvirus 1B]ADK70898.1 envelope glycoprotein O [Elephant endotheliotropic herpesvirus 1B]AGE09969.1 envelope glycoprotein O [Elephantid betaherpesvirus 1]